MYNVGGFRGGRGGGRGGGGWPSGGGGGYGDGGYDVTDTMAVPSNKVKMLTLFSTQALICICWNKQKVRPCRKILASDKHGISDITTV